MAVEQNRVKYAIPEGTLVKKTVLTVESKSCIRSIKKAGRDLADWGVSHETTGNMSMRLDDSFIITSTGCDFSSLSDEDFVMVEEFDIEGNSIRKASGLKNPSSETPMHALIYKSRPDVRAIIHVHDKVLIGDKAVAKLRLPVTSTQEEYGTVGIAKAVADVLAKSDVAVAKGHGIVMVGKNIEEVTDRLITLRRRAK